MNRIQFIMTIAGLFGIKYKGLNDVEKGEGTFDLSKETFSGFCHIRVIKNINTKHPEYVKIINNCKTKT